MREARPSTHTTNVDMSDECHLRAVSRELPCVTTVMQFAEKVSGEVCKCSLVGVRRKELVTIIEVQKVDSLDALSTKRFLLHS